MADDAPKPEATPTPSFSSYEGLGSTVLVTLANLIPSIQGRIIATVVAAPLGAALGRYIRMMCARNWPAPTSRPSGAKSSMTSWSGCVVFDLNNYYWTRERLLIRVQPVGMFPHTHHVENVVLLDLK